MREFSGPRHRRLPNYHRSYNSPWKESPGTSMRLFPEATEKTSWVSVGNFSGSRSRRLKRLSPESQHRPQKAEELQREIFPEATEKTSRFSTGDSSSSRRRGLVRLSPETHQSMERKPRNFNYFPKPQRGPAWF